MTSRLYLQKAIMHLSREQHEKALESLLAALTCNDDDLVSETKVRCILGEFFFVHRQYDEAEKHLRWILEHAEELEREYDDLVNEEIRTADALLREKLRFHL